MCDIKVALQESVKGKWDGDVDLGDGKLQELCSEHENRRAEAWSQYLKLPGMFWKGTYVSWLIHYKMTRSSW